MSELITDEMLDRIREIAERRTDAFRAADRKGRTSREVLDEMGEATTADDIQALHAARMMLDHRSREVLDLYSEVWQEWGRLRCGVCGRTAKQNQALGYDCVNEC